MAAEQAMGIASVASVSPEDVAAAAGAADLFLFRRISEGRFAHLGGVGRGCGWAGIVEIGVDEEPVVAEAVSSGSVVRRQSDEGRRVFGPYYAKNAAIVPVDDDLFAVFGSNDQDLLGRSDEALFELASLAGSSIGDVAASKRLADELEVVNAVRELLCSAHESFTEAAESVARQAALALSCEVGVLYVPELDHLATFDQTTSLPAAPETVRDAMKQISANGNLPRCIQDASDIELPAPFSSTDGTVSYYLLGLEEPVAAVLLLAHTVSEPRGFTLLCQSLGARLVEAAGPLLATALARDGLRDDLVRAAAQARRDSLTGLANRLAWDEAIANHEPTTRPVSIIMLDCDGLKNANDTLGHHVGDRLLRRTADVARAAVREIDLVARIGGDEFAILLDDADEHAIELVVSRIEMLIADEPPIETANLNVAIGTATTRTGDLAAAQREADTRMLAAKHA